MKIKMIAGEYNAELVKKVQMIAEEHADEHLQGFDIVDVLGELENEYGRDAVMDAVFHACTVKEKMIADQELYFEDQLFGDEYPYFMERFFCS